MHTTPDATLLPPVEEVPCTMNVVTNKCQKPDISAIQTQHLSAQHSFFDPKFSLDLSNLPPTIGGTGAHALLRGCSVRGWNCCSGAPFPPIKKCCSGAEFPFRPHIGPPTPASQIRDDHKVELLDLLPRAEPEYSGREQNHQRRSPRTSPEFIGEFQGTNDTWGW
jgi:hypothetical protein